MDGLGNQLYQYAFGQALRTMGSEVAYDVSWYTTNLQRIYSLDKFKIRVDIHSFLDQPIYTQKYVPELVPIDNINFAGFWQALKYHRIVLPQLKNEIYVREELYTDEFLDLKEKITKTKAVSFHVRRGDLIGDMFYAHHILPAVYYKEALLMLQHTSFKNVYIFSDDLDWCKQNFEGATFVDLQDYLCFELMRLCEYNVISYSSYSHWAACLNQNESKRVVYPNMLRWWKLSKEEQLRGKKLPVLLRKRILKESYGDRNMRISHRLLKGQIFNDWIAC
jgi:hypothetical protein